MCTQNEEFMYQFSDLRHTNPLNVVAVTSEGNKGHLLMNFQ